MHRCAMRIRSDDLAVFATSVGSDDGRTERARSTPSSMALECTVRAEGRLLGPPSRPAAAAPLPLLLLHLRPMLRLPVRRLRSPRPRAARAMSRRPLLERRRRSRGPPRRPPRPRRRAAAAAAHAAPHRHRRPPARRRARSGCTGPRTARRRPPSSVGTLPSSDAGRSECCWPWLALHAASVPDLELWRWPEPCCRCWAAACGTCSMPTWRRRHWPCTLGTPSRWTWAVVVWLRCPRTGRRVVASPRRKRRRGRRHGPCLPVRLDPCPCHGVWVERRLTRWPEPACCGLIVG